MLVSEFDELMEVRPFAPFTLITADGREVTVKSPEFAWRSPHTLRTVFVATGPGEVVRMVDLHYVTQVVLGANGPHRDKRRRGKAA